MVPSRYVLIRDKLRFLISSIDSVKYPLRSLIDDTETGYFLNYILVEIQLRVIDDELNSILVLEKQITIQDINQDVDEMELINRKKIVDTIDEMEIEYNKKMKKYYM